jgi:hypothetical protein
MADSFGALATLAAGDRTLELVRLGSLAPEYVWGAKNRIPPANPHFSGTRAEF